MFNVEALTVNLVRAISNQRYRRAGAIRPGSKNISKTDKGSAGTQESLPSPKEIGFPRIDQTRTIRAVRVDIATLTSAKKRRYRMVSEPRETEGKEKGEGSLSILIVLTEGWRISSMKAT